METIANRALLLSSREQFTSSLVLEEAAKPDQVFAVLLIEFREFAVPFSILFINVLSQLGVVAGLWITGVSFYVSSFVGFIMIICIVAENAVFLMH